MSHIFPPHFPRIFPWIPALPRRRVLIIGGSFSGLAAGRDLGSHYLVTIIDAKDLMGWVMNGDEWWWMVMNGDEWWWKKSIDDYIYMSFRCFRFLGKNECSRLSHQADAVEILGFCMRSISSTLLESCVLTSSPSTWMPWPSPCSQLLRQLHHEILLSQIEQEVRGECR